MRTNTRPDGEIVHDSGAVHDGCGGSARYQRVRLSNGSIANVRHNTDGTVTYDYGDHERTYHADGFQYDCEGRRIQ